MAANHRLAAGHLSLRYAFSLLLILGIGVGLGCGGSGQSLVQPSELARFSLPAERNAPYPVDSLVNVKVVEKGPQIKIEMEKSFEGIMRDWSATWRRFDTGRDITINDEFRTFATLWSKDLSYAALKAEGIDGLQGDAAYNLLDRRQKEFDDIIQIDVYWFEPVTARGSGPNETSIVGPGTIVLLRDSEGNEYRPVREDREPPRDALSTRARSRPVVYRRNLFFFQRVVDGRDILTDADKLFLVVNRSDTSFNRGSARFQFAWDLLEGAQDS